MLRHVGDIVASRAIQVGIKAFPDLRSALLDRIVGVIESRYVLSNLGIIYIGELGLRFTPQSLHRSGEAS